MAVSPIAAAFTFAGMEPRDPALLIAVGAGVLLVASAIWAEFRFGDFDRLPAQFGPDLKPTWFAPRFVVLWLTPGIFVIVLGIIAWVQYYAGDKDIGGDAAPGTIIACVLTVLSQALILALLARWARERR